MASRWRDVFPVHPCSDVFPMMPDDDIKELAEDIRKHGVQKPIVLWRSGPDQPWQVLDGRNRLQAVSRLGVDLPRISNGINPEIQMPNGDIVRDVFTCKHNVIDPAALVISANIHRRHLTKEQRAELIIRTITAGKNDGAMVARSFNPTAGVRGGSSKDPVLAEAVQEGLKHGITKRTTQRARARLQGKTPARKKKTTDMHSQVQVADLLIGSRESQTPVTPVPVDSPPAPKTTPAAPEVTTARAIKLTTPRPDVSIPRRPDSRRQRGNATGAQRRPRRRRPGQVGAIAERRVRAFALRKSGLSYRDISRQLGADLHTVHGDIQAELVAIRVKTIEEARDLRALELERLDGMTSGLWPRIQDGSAAAVSAGVRVSERRSRLLGLDAPVVMKSELTGSLGVYAERLAADRELFAKLDVKQLEVLAAESQALVDRAMTMVRANAMTPAGATARHALVDGGEGNGEPAEKSPASAGVRTP